MPTASRRSPALVLKLDNGEYLLCDAGEGIQTGFSDANLRYDVPLTILITHLHGDHIIGLPGLLFRFSLQGRTAPITLVGPRGILGLVQAWRKYIFLKVPVLQAILELDANGLGVTVQHNYFEGGELARSETISCSDGIVLRTPEYRLQAAAVLHSVPAFGYRVTETPRRGRFDPEKAAALGIPRGRLWGILSTGRSIEYGGRVIDPVAEGIVGPERPGRVVSYLGDTTECPNIQTLARGATVLITECTYPADLADMAMLKAHMTSEMAARAALEAGAKCLILTHFSARITDFDALLGEARTIFPNAHIANDLDVFPVHSLDRGDP
jgi:ribonuclease Z